MSFKKRHAHNPCADESSEAAIIVSDIKLVLKKLNVAKPKIHFRIKKTPTDVAICYRVTSGESRFSAFRAAVSMTATAHF